MLTERTRKLLALSKLRGIGPATLDQLLALPELDRISITELAKLNSKVAKASANAPAWDEAVRGADSDIEAAIKLKARIICALDSEYPALLQRVPDRPFFLYARGKWASQPLRAVAVIGTRQPTEHGKVTAERIAEFLVADGWSLVSGLALGCDAIAHQVALARSGHTVAVLAHGLHTVAPKQHEALANRILEQGGMLVTEYAFGINPISHQFVKRDRIQAGLGQGVVMIQSDREGGSLHASRAAIDYRRILAVPSPTARDIANREKKIEANLLLCDGSVEEKARLLACTNDDLRRLLIVRSKDDYALLSRTLCGAMVVPTLSPRDGSGDPSEM